MNMNNRLRTTWYEMDIRIHTVDVSYEADEVTYHENYLKQILPTVFFSQKYIGQVGKELFCVKNQYWLPLASLLSPFAR